MREETQPLTLEAPACAHTEHFCPRALGHSARLYVQAFIVERPQQEGHTHTLTHTHTHTHTLAHTHTHSHTHEAEIQPSFAH